MRMGARRGRGGIVRTLQMGDLELRARMVGMERAAMGMRVEVAYAGIREQGEVRTAGVNDGNVEIEKEEG